ncbi:MAG: SPOR domain-containing protein [Bacteroidota bacterium]
MANQIFLFSFTLDLKTLIIIVLLAILAGVFLTINNFRNGAYFGNELFGNVPTLFLLMLIIGIVLYSMFIASNDTEAIPADPSAAGQQRIQDPGNKPLFENQTPFPPISTDQKKRENTYLTSSAPAGRFATINESAPWHTGQHTTYAIQVAAFASMQNAQQAAESYARHHVEIIKETDWFKILLTGFLSYENAKQYQEKHGIEGFIYQLENEEELIANYQF